MLLTPKPDAKPLFAACPLPRPFSGFNSYLSINNARLRLEKPFCEPEGFSLLTPCLGNRVWRFCLEADCWKSKTSGVYLIRTDLLTNSGRCSFLNFVRSTFPEQNFRLVIYPSMYSNGKEQYVQRKSVLICTSRYFLRLQVEPKPCQKTKCPSQQNHNIFFHLSHFCIYVCIRVVYYASFVLQIFSGI